MTGPEPPTLVVCFAGVALLVGASNLTLFGIGSAFWAIVAGVLPARFLRRDPKGGP